MAALPKLCVSVTEPTIDLAREAIDAAAAAGAFCEVRLDALEAGGALTVEALEPLCARPPVLLTWRLPRDGGRREADDRWRLGLLAEAAQRTPAMVDVEFDRLNYLETLGIAPDRLVLSHHDLERTGSELPDLVERMMKVPAAVVKVATSARSSSDQFVHFDLLARGRAAGRPLVAIAMGPKGFSTRVLGPAFGAPFTFCSLASGAESAPGQGTLADMRDLYRAPVLTRETAVLGLVAGDIGYTLSPAIHNRACAAHGVDAVYVPFEIDDLDAFWDAGVRGTRAGWNLRGLSVTNPFKERVLGLVDDVDATARRVGAVNTVVVNDHWIKGYNTDMQGVLDPLTTSYGSLERARVAVVGTGGAARAVLAALESQGTVRFVVGRNAERAAALGVEFGATPIGVDDIRSARLDVLVNATPVGTLGGEEDVSPVPADALRGVSLVYDLVYNPPETLLIKDAVRAGCRTMNGLEMLETQAALQFALWTGVPNKLGAPSRAR